MGADRRASNEGVREFRLEGFGLVVIGSVLVVALAGAFYAGRVWERRQDPGIAGLGPSRDPLAHVVDAPPPADVEESATYFDTLEGEQKQVEPERQVAPPSTRAAATTEPAKAVAAPAIRGDASGLYYVQIFAGRDRRAAEGLVNELKAGSYRVKIFSNREGQSGLYKVRVGGYPSRDKALEVAQALMKQGYSGAWVPPPVDPANTPG